MEGEREAHEDTFLLLLLFLLGMRDKIDIYICSCSIAIITDKFLKNDERKRFVKDTQPRIPLINGVVVVFLVSSSIY